MQQVQKYKNKKAYFQYELNEVLVAGIQLKGTEIKSIRDGKVSFTDAFCQIDNGEMWVKGLHISEYVLGTCNNHDPKRDRKLLLSKREIRQWQRKVNEKGFTIIPVSLFIDENGRAKLEIALARGKKQFDKRESIKKKDIQRDMERQ
ncbi:MAG TPA: SsrA-binding protein [Bacteroidales bacterium]|nr:SsrA-binding protein [Bacteroidales bacterium]HOE04339.1 SsrA-binding protein [Bacteroidales bacterium]HQL69901.1 SsrA-binding protein [Bacteroidales bacterium]